MGEVSLGTLNSQTSIGKKLVGVTHFGQGSPTVKFTPATEHATMQRTLRRSASRSSASGATISALSMEEYGIELTRRFRLIAELVE
jgi:hypothetical protein